MRVFPAAYICLRSAFYVSTLHLAIHCQIPSSCFSNTHKADTGDVYFASSDSAIHRARYDSSLPTGWGVTTVIGGRVEVHVSGYNLGASMDDIVSFSIRGVECSTLKRESSNSLVCVSGHPALTVDLGKVNRQILLGETAKNCENVKADGKKTACHIFRVPACDIWRVVSAQPRAEGARYMCNATIIKSGFLRCFGCDLSWNFRVYRGSYTQLPTRVLEGCTTVVRTSQGFC